MLPALFIPGRAAAACFAERVGSSGRARQCLTACGARAKVAKQDHSDILIICIMEQRWLVAGPHLGRGPRSCRVKRHSLSLGVKACHAPRQVSHAVRRSSTLHQHPRAGGWKYPAIERDPESWTVRRRAAEFRALADRAIWPATISGLAAGVAAPESHRASEGGVHGCFPAGLRFRGRMA